MYLSEGLNLLIGALAVFCIAPLRRIFWREPASSGHVTKRTRIEYFDFLKGLAIVSVIIIHIAWFFQHLHPNNNHFFINIFTDPYRFAIPLFFICSGVLLAAFDGGKQDWGRYYANKFFRIVVPYLLMNILFAAYLNPSLEEFFVFILSGILIPPYYFVVVLVIFYLLFPFISRFKDSKIFLFVSFFISFLSFFLTQLWVYGILTITANLFFFFVYGMYMRNYFLRGLWQKNEAFWWLVPVLLYVWIMIGFPGFYYNNQFFYGIAVFNLLFIFRDSLSRLPKAVFGAVCSYGRNSLWIFLTHFFVMYVVYTFFSMFDLNYYLFYFLTGVVSLFLCYLAGVMFTFVYNRFLSMLNIKI